jgi:hypothetical protein
MQDSMYPPFLHISVGLDRMTAASSCLCLRMLSLVCRQTAMKIAELAYF